MKNKKLLKRLLITAAIITVLCAGVSDFLYSNPQIKFTVDEFLKSSDNRVEFSPITVKTVSTSLDELKKDGRTTVNQAMMLINADNPLREEFKADITCYGTTDIKMNSCITDAYSDLSAAVSEKFGSKLLLSDSCRTANEQSQSEDESEHRAGLGLDVYVKYHSGKAFLKSEEGRFVNSQCWQYGFIIRYPSYGKKETGVKFEPWHIRYVGAPHAEIIYKNRLTLEEYHENLEIGKFYKYGDYIVSRQRGVTAAVPTEYRELTVSQDNGGAYIYTFKI